MKKIITFFLLFFSIHSNVAYASNTDTQELKVYVEKLLQDGYDMFHDHKLSKEELRKKSKNLIASNLHLDWMAKHSLGRFRRQVSPEKLQNFIEVYSDFIVKAYTDLASHYSGERAVFKSIKQIDTDLFMVSTEISKPGEQSPIKVEYLVHKVKNQGNRYLVGDVITEGISLLNSQQSEFKNILSRDGIDALISDLKKRNSNNAVQPVATQ